MADNHLRQKLSRCVNFNQYNERDRRQSLKLAFGNIQDAEVSAKAKQSLMANGCISVLIQLLECDSLGPELPGGENFDIWDKNGPEIRYKYQLMADAALALKRMMEIGQNEKFLGRKRIQKAVSEGAIEVLVPHL